MAQTLGDLMETVFPYGTNPSKEQKDKKATADTPERWQVIPFFAADIFAFCAHVIHTTGLMGYFDPSKGGPKIFGPDDLLKVVLDEEEREFCEYQSENWRKMGKIPDDTISLWSVIYDARDKKIRIEGYQEDHKKVGTTSAAPQWWEALFKLLIIADEACDGIGHKHNGDDNNVADIAFFFARLEAAGNIEAESADIDGIEAKAKRAKRGIKSLAITAADSVITVQPKGRVTSV